MGRDGGYVITCTKNGQDVIMDTDNPYKLWFEDKWIDVFYIKNKEMPIFDRNIETRYNLHEGELKEICEVVILLVG